MQMIRTTINLPKDLHEELRILAFKNRASLSDIVVSKIRDKKILRNSKKSLEKEIEKSLAFFEMIRKRGQQFDAVKAVRLERNRDNA